MWFYQIFSELIHSLEVPSIPFREADRSNATEAKPCSAVKVSGETILMCASEILDAAEKCHVQVLVQSSGVD